MFGKRRKVTSEKVLIVDDEQDLLDAMAQRMEIFGIDVSTTTSPWDALDRIGEEAFDAIIIDLMMPAMDGLEFLKALKSKSPDTQVLLLTGHATVSMGIQAMKLGAMDLIEKPADLRVLVEKIKKAKSRKEAAGLKTEKNTNKDKNGIGPT